MLLLPFSSKQKSKLSKCNYNTDFYNLQKQKTCTCSLHQLDLWTSQLIELKCKTNRTSGFPKQYSKRCWTRHSSTTRQFESAQPYLRYEQQRQRMRSKVNTQKILKLNPQSYDFTNTTSYLLPKNELSNSNKAHTPWNANHTVQALCM